MDVYETSKCRGGLKNKMAVVLSSDVTMVGSAVEYLPKLF